MFVSISVFEVDGPGIGDRKGLLPARYVNTMATSDIDEPIASDTKLAVEIKRACIADGGKLTDTYQYIQVALAADYYVRIGTSEYFGLQNVRAVHESRTQTGEAEGATSTVMLTGHLFDTGLINQAQRQTLRSLQRSNAEYCET